MNTRAIAAKSIIDILEKRYSLLTLDSKLKALKLSDKDKGFVKLLNYELFRNYFSLEKILYTHISKKTNQRVKILIMLGILQIFEINQPDYAILNETVSACKMLKVNWARKLVNGVLRKTIKNIDVLSKQYEDYKQNNLPEWLITILQKQYPDEYQNIIKAFNSKADMFIRINSLKNIDFVLEEFNKDNIGYENQEELKNCFRLQQAINIENNDLFQNGFYSVQDLSAQYAGIIINPQKNDKILDACAAPGGKTTHLLELCKTINLTAIDLIDKRLNLLESNLNRVCNNEHNVKLLKHDLTKPLAGNFNKIMLDAPCSALGTIKRNPDIKVLRQSKDIELIIKTQSKILQNLWSNNLSKNGYLLYITCSILQQENEEQIKSFLEKNNDVQVIDIDKLKKHRIGHGYQILPQKHKGDGFYYCLLKKISL